jgi:uncharacterized protein YccT (UPF0319 family)
MEAGFRVSPKKETLNALRYWWRKATAEERATFLAEIGKA